MSTAIIKADGNGNGLGLQDLMTLGDVFKASGYFKDVRDQSQAVVKILYGKELGFSPVVSMMGIHIIEGKPALSANLMGALVKRSGKYNYRVETLTDQECTLQFTENGQPCGESKFTIADAQRAGVVRPGGGWQKYPRNMLFARALSNGAKLFCPELSSCPIYVPEELGAEVNEEGAVVSHPVAQPTTITEPKTYGRPKAEIIGNTDTSQPIESLRPKPEPEQNGGAVTQTAEPAAADLASTTPADSVEYCTPEMQTWLRLEFESLLPQKHKKHADEFRRDWLKVNGYKNEKGAGTSTRIPLATFKGVAKDCLNHAKTIAAL